MDTLHKENIVITRIFLGEKSEGKFINGTVKKVHTTITVDNELIYDNHSDWIDHSELNTPILYLHDWLTGSAHNNKPNNEKNYFIEKYNNKQN